MNESSNEDLDTLRAELTRLQGRVHRLDAVGRIERLMYRYIAACDVAKDADLIASMFTEDASWEGQGHFAEFGVTQGREAIREMFVGNPAMLPFTAHFLTNPSIGVSQDCTAGWGSWHVLEAATLRDHRAQVWMLAWYDNDFVEVGGSWLIRHLRFRATVVVPYEDGWLQTRYVSPLTFTKISTLDPRQRS